MALSMILPQQKYRFPGMPLDEYDMHNFLDFAKFIPPTINGQPCSKQLFYCTKNLPTLQFEQEQSLKLELETYRPIIDIFVAFFIMNLIATQQNTSIIANTLIANIMLPIILQNMMLNPLEFSNTPGGIYDSLNTTIMLSGKNIPSYTPPGNSITTPNSPLQNNQKISTKPSSPLPNSTNQPIGNSNKTPSSSQKKKKIVTKPPLPTSNPINQPKTNGNKTPPIAPTPSSQKKKKITTNPPSPLSNSTNQPTINSSKTPSPSISPGSLPQDKKESVKPSAPPLPSNNQPKKTDGKEEIPAIVPPAAFNAGPPSNKNVNSNILLPVNSKGITANKITITTPQNDKNINLDNPPPYNPELGLSTPPSPQLKPKGVELPQFDKNGKLLNPRPEFNPDAEQHLIPQEKNSPNEKDNHSKKSDSIKSQPNTITHGISPVPSPTNNRESLIVLSKKDFKHKNPYYGDAALEELKKQQQQYLNAPKLQQPITEKKNPYYGDAAFGELGKQKQKQNRDAPIPLSSTKPINPYYGSDDNSADKVKNNEDKNLVKHPLPQQNLQPDSEQHYNNGAPNTNTLFALKPKPPTQLRPNLKKSKKDDENDDVVKKRRPISPLSTEPSPITGQ